RARAEKFDFTGAIGTLRGVIRYARAESPAAAEAMDRLPALQYAAALHAYGQAAPGVHEDRLPELSASFPKTPWDEKARRTLQRIGQPPEGMVYVPEGRFRMGTDLDEILALVREKAPGEWDEETVQVFADVLLGNETPQHVLSTGAFFIDKTEVTNEQFKRFCDEAGHPPPPHWTEGSYPEGTAMLPVVNVSLAEAQAYAGWRGGRLPTEAEWEKAARGVDGRSFPWGNVYSDQACQHMRPEGAGPLAVGSFPSWDSPYGCLDMIGNVHEWTTSHTAPYPGSTWSVEPASKGWVVARGGAWFQEELVPIPARCASRYPVDPKAPTKTTGFRCVRDVAEPEEQAGTEGAE
ncbi:MAG: formylglycine-generating enzyme family protein, partial [Planctomycetota bacterium]